MNIKELKCVKGTIQNSEIVLANNKKMKLNNIGCHIPMEGYFLLKKEGNKYNLRKSLFIDDPYAIVLKEEEDK